MNRPAIWIAWERQLRNRSVSSALGVPLFEILHGSPRPVRYVRSLASTVRLLARHRPGVVFAPNPSLVLTYLLLFLRMVFRFELVSDAHLGGVVAFNGSRVLQRLLDLANARADLVIVTNELHAERLRRIGARGFVLEDPLPRLGPVAGGGGAPDEKVVLFVCSYDIDEPYAAVFRAAGLLAPEGFRVVASGNYRKVGLKPEAFPQVRFLGFVPEDEYYAWLFRAAVVLDLTEWEGCLVCGAYEAMAAGKPVVLSDRKGLRSYFTAGAVFTAHEPGAIAQAVRAAYRERLSMAGEIARWREWARADTRDKIAELWRRLPAAPADASSVREAS